MDGSRPELSDWLEGYLFDRRITVVRGALDDATATRVATEMMTLDATGDEAVTLHLDSPGGSLSAAFTLVDVMEALGVPVNVLCMGRVEGTAVAVAAAGTRRLAMAHTQFRFGEPEIAFEARASQAEELARAHLDLVGRFHETIARHSGQAVDDVERWCTEGRHFAAPEAVRLGIVDEVSQGKAPLRSIR